MSHAGLNFTDYIVSGVIFVGGFSFCFYKLFIFFKKALKLEANYKEALISVVYAVFFIATGFWILCVSFMDFFTEFLLPIHDVQGYTTHYHRHIIKFCVGSILSVYVLSILIYVVLYFKKNKQIKEKVKLS